MAKGKEEKKEGMSAADAKKEVPKISKEQQAELDAAMEDVKGAMRLIYAASKRLADVKQPHTKVVKEKEYCDKKVAALATYLSYRDPELRKVKEKERKQDKLKKLQTQMAELKKELGIE